ncbi:MAG TPA: transglycosylase domain-containing protein [Frankiaceae bacterium]|nr:transglycosylase domain-containing protein [Frankiaceae bacterium]
MAQTLVPRRGGGNPAPAGRARRRRRFPLVRWTLLAALVGALSFVGGLLAAPIDLTVPDRLPAALLLDANERYFASIRAPEIREDVPASAIPEKMRLAIIAAEDERFLQHKGVDPVAIMRAAYRDIVHESRQGGSTITQQYVKNIYVGSDRTLERKLKEAALAYRAEKKFGKDEILIRYLNSVYLGNGTYGVQAASKFYFGVPIKDLALNKATGERSEALELARAAMLAGLVAAPSRYNPVADLKLAKERQFYTLERMSTNLFITPIEASRAYREPLKLAKLRPPAEATEAPLFTDMVTRELKETLTDDDIYRGGLRVRTTLDLIMQRAVEQSVYDALPGLNPKSLDPAEPDTAVVAIDPRNGDLKAIYSSRYTLGGFSVANHGKVPTGSAIKPFTLAAALMNGKTLDTTYYATNCTTIPNPGGKRYTPCNAERGETGTYTLRRALAYSLNTVYARLAHDVGRTKVKKVLTSTGVGPAEGIGTNPAMALGAVNVTPLSVAQGYATLAAGGVRRDYRMILEQRRGADTKKTFSGIPVMRAPETPRGRQVVPKDVADRVVEAMHDVVDYGTGRTARVPGKRVFGKTGTTDEFTNAWFAGCAPELCVVTWLGHKSGNKPLRNIHGHRSVYGGTLPAQIFRGVFTKYDELLAAEARSEEVVAAASPSATPTRRRTPAATVPVRPTTQAPRPTAPPSPTVTTEPTPTTAAPTTPAPTTPAPTTSAPTGGTSPSATTSPGPGAGPPGTGPP